MDNPSDLAYLVVGLAPLAVSALGAWYAKRTHTQVSKNHHESKNPTVPDRIDDVKKSVERLEELFLEHLANHDRDKK